MNKRTLSITAINEILQKIPEEQKLEKNIALIEQLYIDYQKEECDDAEDILRLSAALANRPVLVIGPGASIKRYRREIEDYAERHHPCTISINYIPQFFHPDYMFITNSTRFIQSVSRLHEDRNTDIKLIASSNLSKLEREFDYIVNYTSVIDETAEFPDNSMCMLIRTLMRCGCREIALAGLDGYTPDNVNYYDEEKAYSFLREKANSLNDYARGFFRDIAGRVALTFVTPSEYQKDK